jgi:hypothetical protein
MIIYESCKLTTQHTFPKIMIEHYRLSLSILAEIDWERLYNYLSYYFLLCVCRVIYFRTIWQPSYDKFMNYVSEYTSPPCLTTGQSHLDQTSPWIYLPIVTYISSFFLYSLSLLRPHFVHTVDPPYDTISS